MYIIYILSDSISSALLPSYNTQLNYQHINMRVTKMGRNVEIFIFCCYICDTNIIRNINKTAIVLLAK